MFSGYVQTERRQQLEVTRWPLKAGFVGLLRPETGMPEAFQRQLAYLTSWKTVPRQTNSSALDEYCSRGTLQTGF